MMIDGILQTARWAAEVADRQQRMVDSILSGPAAIAVQMAEVARQLEERSRWISDLADKLRPPNVVFTPVVPAFDFPPELASDSYTGLLTAEEVDPLGDFEETEELPKRKIGFRFNNEDE